MKKYILLTLLLFASFFAYSQTSFHDFETNEKVNAVVVNKKMFELMTKIKVDANDLNAQKYIELIKNLDYLRVLTSNDLATSKQLLTTANDYVSKNSLQQLKQSEQNNRQVKIYVKQTGKGDLISELVMLVEDQKNANRITIMTLDGNFSTNSLYVLTDKIDLPGSEEIKSLHKN